MGTKLWVTKLWVSIIGGSQNQTLGNHKIGHLFKSTIVTSTKSVIMTDNVVMFCLSEVVPTRSWVGVGSQNFRHNK